MEYTMEELLPIVTELSKKYTSFESSSVTYETAKMLMEAVIYTIDQCLGGDGRHLPFTAEKLLAREVYEKGYGIIIEKTKKAKGIYEQIVANFQGYGCRNYDSSICQGIPSFFLYYDARFQPQNHILTLDYPSIGRFENLSGVERICKFLTGIQWEKMFLDQFNTQRIQRLLDRVMPDGKENFMDNICEIVLLCAVGCVIADRPINQLKLDVTDTAIIREFFADDSTEHAEQRISGMIRMIVREIMPESDGETENYFRGLSREFAVRIRQPEFIL